MTFESLRDQFEALTDIVRDAESMLISGSGISNFRDLERRVKALCDSVLRGDPVTAKAVQPYMADLIAALDSYAEHLTDFKNRKGKDV